MTDAEVISLFTEQNEFLKKTNASLNENIVDLTAEIADLSENGTQSSCLLFSLIETAKKHGINPKDHLRCLFE